MIFGNMQDLNWTKITFICVSVWIKCTILLGKIPGISIQNRPYVGLKLLKKIRLSSDISTLEVRQINDWKLFQKQAYCDSEFQEINKLKISFYVKFINVNKSIVPKTIIAVWNQNSNHMSDHRILNLNFKKKNWLQISFYIKVINFKKIIVSKTIAVWNQNSNYGLITELNFKKNKLIINFHLHKSYQCQ